MPRIAKGSRTAFKSVCMWRFTLQGYFLKI